MNIKYVNKNGDPVNMDEATNSQIQTSLRAMTVSARRSDKSRRRLKQLQICVLLSIAATLLIIGHTPAPAPAKTVGFIPSTYISMPVTTTCDDEELHTESLLGMENESIVVESAVGEYKQIREEPFRPEALSPELFEVVVRECNASGIPINAALAIMKTETQSFSASAVNYNTNGTYDSGIMQINSSNIYTFAKKYNCPEFANDPHNAVNNITVGIRFFSELYNEYYSIYQSDVKALLAASGAYNRGQYNQDKYKNIYEYNARVYAHYTNLCERKDVDINYAEEIPEIKNWLRTNVQL